MRDIAERYRVEQSFLNNGVVLLWNYELFDSK